MKLQYRETKWWAGEVPETIVWKDEDKTVPINVMQYIATRYRQVMREALSQFKEIAPQDQEKVNEHFRNWEEEVENLYVIQWGPEIGKLYDSGDLVFELEHECEEKIIGCNGCNCKQFWVLRRTTRKTYC